MNLKKLKQAEETFLMKYPGGFDNPEMIEIRKKHNVDKMIALAQDGFSKVNFKQPDLIIDTMIKIIGRSSVISVFEKPKFRDFANSITPESRKLLTWGLGELFHGDEPLGFKTVVDCLRTGKLANWSIVTVCLVYFRPHREVLIKPTTVKRVIEYFELQNLQYKPTPTWEFYDAYRSAFNEMKSMVDSALSPTNAAFSGFLMMSLDHK